MKKIILLAMLMASSMAAAAEKETPSHLNCTINYLVLDEHGGSIKEETIQTRLDLTPAALIEQEFPEGKVHAFVCNTDPVQSFLLVVENTQGERVAISETNVNVANANLFGYVRPLKGNGGVSIGISCSAPAAN